MKQPTLASLIKWLLALSFFLVSCTSQEKQKIIIFHAGSLSVPFKKMEQLYEKSHPQVDIVLEAAGSVASARKITDLNRTADIMASADYRIIDELLIPEYAQWNISFAANEMVIACREESPIVSILSESNWMDILQQQKVRYGRANPDHDPCGYRTVLTLKLAEKYYKRNAMAQEILQKDQRFIRPKETDLLALLESGTLDAIFIYRSVAGQHQLPYITLPDSINLKQPSLSSWYRTASVAIAGKKPGEEIVLQGAPMVYGITILRNAPNKQEAMQFLEWLLSKDGGQRILENQGQPSLVPMSTQTFNKIPKTLKPYAKP